MKHATVQQGCYCKIHMELLSTSTTRKQSRSSATHNGVLDGWMQASGGKNYRKSVIAIGCPYD